MLDSLLRLKEEKIPYLFCNQTSLDLFFRVREDGPLYIATDSSIISLARVFDQLQFPGLPLEDATVTDGTRRLVFRCVESLDSPPSYPFTVQGLLYDPDRDIFLDTRGLYPDLRARKLAFVTDSHPAWLGLCEAARLVSRYHYSAEGISFAWNRERSLPPLSYQRDLLEGLLASGNPEKGFALLFSAGFVDEAWPELAAMAGIPHVKDYHPEGNVWEHTLATFTHRKRPDATLSLALLLHDIGKPDAEGAGEKRFDGHSDLGARIASRFLRRLQFPVATVEAVDFLVRYHMMPAALKALPPFRTERVLASPMFPILLELYRADLSSSYLDEAGYYEACRIYKAYLRDKGNPYLAVKRRRQRAAAHRR